MTAGRRLGNGPGLTPPKQPIQIPFALAKDHFLYLQVEHVLIARPVCLIKNAKGSRQMSLDLWIVKHPHQDLGLVEVLLIMYPAIIFAEPTTQFHYNGPETLEPDTFIPVGAKHKRLALFQKKRLHGFAALLGKHLESPVIENIAILIDLEEAGAPVGLAAQQELLQVLGVPVHAPCYKRGIRTHCEGQGIKGMVDAPERGRFRN